VKARAAGTRAGYADPLQPTAADLGPWAEEAVGEIPPLSGVPRLAPLAPGPIDILTLKE
jgi:hypothetical protein